MKKLSTAAIVVLTLLIIVFGTWRSAQLQYQTGMGDMRGRVVGARLVKEGKLPYYYTWQPGDSLKYFFNQLVDTQRIVPPPVSGLTASPAFLQALGPVAFLQQYKIDWGAFVLFHVFFLIGIALALRYSKKQNWPYVLLIMVPMIITDGWLGNFVTVQYYMLFGFLLFMIAWLLLRKQQIIAGILFAILILWRPTALVFAFPFVIFGLKYIRFLSGTFISLAIYAVAVLSSPFQKSLWQQYFVALKAHQAIHMSDTYTESKDRIATLPFLPNPFEGEDYFKLDSIQKVHPIYVYPEASSFKSAYNSVIGHKPSGSLLLALLFASAGSVWLWLFLKFRKEKNDADMEYKIILAGMLFYFLSSFFSSITSASYQFPQWWAVAAIFGIFYHRIPKSAYMLFLIGLVLNFYLLPGFKGKHFLSEIFLLLATCWAVVAPFRKTEEGPESAAFQGHA
jgi:hypothetical protein